MSGKASSPKLGKMKKLAKPPPIPVKTNGVLFGITKVMRACHHVRSTGRCWDGKSAGWSNANDHKLMMGSA